MFYVGSGAPGIHVPSRRQLPTDHDYDGERTARSADIRVINRRLGFLDHRNHAGL